MHREYAGFLLADRFRDLFGDIDAGSNVAMRTRGSRDRMIDLDVSSWDVTGASNHLKLLFEDSRSPIRDSWMSRRILFVSLCWKLKKLRKAQKFLPSTRLRVPELAELMSHS